MQVSMEALLASVTIYDSGGTSPPIGKVSETIEGESRLTPISDN